MGELCGRIFGALLAFAALVIPTGAQAADQVLIDAARKEGVVVWYTSFVENQLARPLAAAFEKAYPGIKVRIVSGTATDLLLKLLAEQRAGQLQGDVHHGGSSVWPLVKVDAVETYVADAAADYPADLKDPKGRWVADALYFLVAAVNTDLVRPADEPKSFDDLLNPRWVGKIAWTNQLTQGGAAGFIGTVLQSMGQEKGIAYLNKLKAQKLVNVPSNQRVVLDQVIAGEYPMAISVFNTHADISAAKGAPVKWLKLQPVTATLDTVMLLKGPHRSAGKLFIDFVLSVPGQTAVRDAGYIPAHPKVAAKIATQRPEDGNFTTQLLTPDLVEADLPKWVGVYNLLFK